MERARIETVFTTLDLVASPLGSEYLLKKKKKKCKRFTIIIQKRV